MNVTEKFEITTTLENERWNWRSRRPLSNRTSIKVTREKVRTPSSFLSQDVPLTFV